MKELKEKILALLSKHNINLSEETPTEVVVETEQAVAKVKCATASLEDGSEIFTESDTWAIGVNVYKTLPDGTEEVLADGEYMLADGTSIVVSGGVISELETPAADVTEGEPTDMSKELSALMTIVANLEKEIATLKATNETLSSEKESLKAELSKTPAATSITESAPSAVKINQEKQSKPFSQMTYTERVMANLNKN